MSQRLRAVLLSLGVLAAVGVAVLLVLGPGNGTPETPAGQGTFVGRGGPSPTTGPTLAPSPGPHGGAVTTPSTPPRVRPRPGETEVRPGLRVPEGVDLTDPRQADDLLQKTLKDQPVDWQRVEQIMAVYPGRVSQEVRDALLANLRVGNRVGAERALAMARDGSLAQDLLRALDETDLSVNARNSILGALASMKGADSAEVIRGIEARLTGNVREDAQALRAIAERGGREGARAVVDYLVRADDPARLAAIGGLRLDLTNADSADVVAKAIGQAPNDKVLTALVRVAGQPGADHLVDSLTALDVGTRPPEFREEVMRSLARIGSDEAVDHLLRSAAEPGTHGSQAQQTIGQMTNATPQARARLLAAYEDARGGESSLRVNVLRALGNLHEKAAVPAMAKALRDPDEGVQLAAVEGLGQMGEAGRSHVQELLDLFGTGSEAMQHRIAVALGGIGGDEARAALDHMSSSESLSPTVVRTARMQLERVTRSETAQN